jgi:hypothetical protein
LGNLLKVRDVCDELDRVKGMIGQLQVLPLDERGGIESSTAQMHVKLVMIMAVLGAIGMLAMWHRLSNSEGWIWYGTYSLVIFIATAITGIIASKTVGTKIMGLTERLVVTLNVQYIFVLALNVFITRG